ncbi:MAG: hypothetical protein ABSE20_09520 [Acetobacteraceae bacterium]
MIDYVRRALTRLGVFASNPAAFVIIFCYFVAWFVLSPSSLNWQAIATFATWLQE